MKTTVAVYQMRLLDAHPDQDEWIEVSEAEFNLPLKDPGQWEKRTLYTAAQSAVTDFAKHSPGNENPQYPADQTVEARYLAILLNHIGNMDADEIDSDIVELRFELDDVDTGTDVSLTYMARASAAMINYLLGKLAANRNNSAICEPADLPAVTDACSASSTDWQKGFTEGQEHNRNAISNTGPLFGIAPKEPPHKDDVAFDAFASACKAKLARSRAKGRAGWDDPDACSETVLARLLVEHCLKGNAGTYEDVACLAMMLHQRNIDPSVLADEATKRGISHADSSSRPGEQVLAGIAEPQARTLKLPTPVSATEYLFPVAVYPADSLRSALTEAGIRWESE